ALAATELERYAAVMQQKTGIVPKQPEREVQPAAQPAAPAESSSGLFDAAMLQQLNTVFSRMANPLRLQLSLDARPVSAELRGYIEELCALTDKLSYEVVEGLEDAPVVRVLRADGSESGLAFHGVPGGHEFTSFVLGLYNAAGPGQAVDEADLARIRAIDAPVQMQVLVSLSCTMCPELVTAAQRIAAENSLVSAEVYDINHFEQLKDKYNVMSVPCLVVNGGEKISFGKKNIPQLLDLLTK
ncbi:MAG: thioredoxin family protein, partial [Oscillospiraceae bacterium]|nr:thioredoxin family protein [Oscillospiraceae bacterium]